MIASRVAASAFSAVLFATWVWVVIFGKAIPYPLDGNWTVPAAREEGAESVELADQFRIPRIPDQPGSITRDGADHVGESPVLSRIVSDHFEDGSERRMQGHGRYNYRELR